MNSVNAIRTAIMNSSFSNDELNEISQSITFARARLRTQVKQTLRVGSLVKFNGRAGTQTGTLKKIAIKFATVQTNTGNWRVPLNMLQSA